MNDVTAFFPGAGSFGGEFQSLIDAHKPAALLVRYPGRFGKNFGAVAESFDAVVDACAAQITRRAPTRAVLFGHSYGAYVAYATALRLQDAGTGAAGIVAVGANAPSRLVVSPEALTDAARYLERVDPQALADAPSDEWRDVVAETTVQDLRLLAEFDTAMSTPVRCPILAVRGHADPLTSDDGIGEWKRYTDDTFSSRVLPGGHSDVLRDPALLLALTI